MYEILFQRGFFMENVLACYNKKDHIVVFTIYCITQEDHSRLYMFEVVYVRGKEA